MKQAILWAGAVSLTLIGQSSQAQTPDQSPRPEQRPDQAAYVVASATGTTLDSAQRPRLRSAAAAGQAEAAVAMDASRAGFDDWLDGFRSRAEAQGIRRQVLDSAFSGIRFDDDVIRRDRNQSEFTKTIWQYLASAVSDSRIENGRSALEAHGETLDAIERRYGVEKEVVLAVWGLESAYGSHRGGNDVVQSLATLAYEGRRGAFFEEQLIAALKILQNGDTSPRNMTGSWAGAMGHTQFIPTSYLAYAVDFNGDGRRDIWSDDPTDALASTAAYLAKSGWTKGQPWGVEVRLPAGFDFTLADRKVTRQPSDWARLGVKDMNGRAVADHGAASILLPAGAQGAAFMIFRNFAAIERYNAADAYVIGVGHLSDRIAGGAPIRATWPADSRALTFAERKEMQRLLTGAGFSTQGVDGRIGPKTVEAIRAFQIRSGIVPDGYASLALLDRLR